MYTDGSCVNNGKENAQCGGGIWCGENHPLNKSIRVPSNLQSNQIGELTAVLVALQSADPLTPVNIITDSKYVINGLTIHLGEWEDQGWINIKNKSLLQATAYQLRKHLAPTTFTWVKGHSGNIGNEKADKLAAEGALKTQPDDLDISIPPNFNLQGIKLETISQKSAYAALRQQPKIEPKRATKVLLDITRYAIQNFTNTLETDSTIWKICRHPDISKKIQIFIFKSLHNVHKIGEFWRNIPLYEHREKCYSCGIDTESLEHILTECDNIESKTIWHLAKRAWTNHHKDWPTLSLGLILGCGALNIPTTQGETSSSGNRLNAQRHGCSRLLRILISESAHLIWVLRCERTI